ncbi:MAG: HupE/UreJ family protein [Phycisphaeraceae bacterium]
MMSTRLIDAPVVVRTTIFATAAMAWLGSASAAWAHPHHASMVHGEHAFAQGLLHPVMGLDHVLAMVAVGLWAGQIGGRRAWALPAAFVGLMLVGGFGAFAGIPLPAVEGGILASVLVLGLLVAAALKLPVAAGTAVAGVAALFHGYAHVSEMAADSSLAAYGAGFALGTAGLCAAGLGASRLLQLRGQAVLVRACGGGIATAGLVLAAVTWL